jgi:uncharacterized membrane protein
MKFMITDLGDVGSKLTATGPVVGAVTAINDAGQAVGRVVVSPSDFHAVFWDCTQSPPTMIDLGAYWKDGTETSIAIAINDNMEVVGGTVPVTQVPTQGHAFYCGNPLMSPPMMKDISLDDVNIVAMSIARGINGDGLSVGQRATAISPRDRAVYWLPGSSDPLALPHILDYPGGKAAAINSSGQIVGRLDVAPLDSGKAHFYACRWSTDEPGTYPDEPDLLWPKEISAAMPPDTPAVFFRESYAWAINDNGDVVGVYGNDVEGQSVPMKDADQHACVWPKWMNVALSIFDDLFMGQLVVKSFAFDINNAGDIVGQVTLQATSTSPAIPYAFYKARESAPILLDTTIDSAYGWTLTTARSISNTRQIVGTGQKGGATHGYLLTP